MSHPGSDLVLTGLGLVLPCGDGIAAARASLAYETISNALLTPRKTSVARCPRDRVTDALTSDRQMPSPRRRPPALLK